MPKNELLNKSFLLKENIGHFLGKQLTFYIG